MTTAPTDEPLGRERSAIKRRLRARLFGVHEEPVRIGRFQVRETLGRGGMGVVYAALDEKLDRVVAVKLIQNLTRPGERDRLLSEARALARLSHPNVVQVYEVGELDPTGAVFIVMERVDGLSLDRWLAEEAPEPPTILAAICDAGRGLAAAHAAGLVHRDIKPSNILVARDGRVRIADFGIARHSELHSTMPDASDASPTSSAAGTPPYMSPEHLSGNATALSDQFSLCVTLHEALYGYRPFTLAELRSCPDAPAEPPAGRIPESARRALTRGLSFRPRDRFDDVTALVRALERSRPRHPLVPLALTALFAALIPSLWSRAPAAEATCVDSLQDIWSSERQARLEHAVRSQPSGARAWERFSRAVDRYALALNAENCAAETTAIDRHCLAARRDDLASLLSEVEDAQPRARVHLFDLTAALPPPSHCRGRVEPSPALAATLAKARSLRATGQALAARDLLVGATHTLDFALDPAGEVEVLHLVAQLDAFDLGDPAGALDRLRRAHDRALEQDHPDAWRILRDLAQVAVQFHEDVPRARELLDSARLTAKRFDPEGARPELDTVEAFIAGFTRDHARALELTHAVLMTHGARLPAEHPDLIRARRRYASALADAGQRPEGLKQLRLLASELLAELGPDHPEVALTEFSAAMLHIDAGEPQQAEDSLRRAREIFARHDGADSLRVAQCDVYFALIAAQNDDPRRAERLARAARRVFEAHLSPRYSLRVLALALLFNAALVRKDDRESLALVELLRAIPPNELVAIQQRDLLVNHADLLCEQGRCAETFDLYTQILALDEKHPPSTDYERAYPHQGFGRYYVARGEFTSAERHLRHALELIARDREPEPIFTAGVLRTWAKCLRGLGRLREARASEHRAARLERPTAAAPQG